MKCYNYGKKCHYARDCPEPQKELFSTISPELYVCSHELVANMIPNWIVDMGASKHVVRDKASFVELYRYSMGSQYVMLGNGNEEDVLGVVTCQLILGGGNNLLLFYALYALGV